MLLHGRVGFREERPGESVMLASTPSTCHVPMCRPPQTGVVTSWATSSWSQLTNHEAPESAYLPGGCALLRGLAEQEADLLEGPCECVSGCHGLGSALAVIPCRGCRVRWSIAGLGGWATRWASFEKCRRVTSVVGTDWRWTFGKLHNPCTRLHRVHRYHSTCRPLTSR